MKKEEETNHIGKIAKFIPAQDIKDRFFAGYEKQIKTGLILGTEAAKGGIWRVMLLGFPGCGKSEFPFVLAYKLNKDYRCNFSLLYIKCHRLASTFDDVQKTKSYLKQLTDKIEKFQPVILAFDEFDAISPRRTTTSALTELSLWTMSFLTNGSEEELSKKMLIFGIANFPSQVDIAVRDRLQYYIYFNLPNEEVITEMLEYKKIPKSKKVSKRLIEFTAKEGQSLTGRGVLFACNTLRHIEGSAVKNILQKKSPEEIANLLLVHALPVSTREIAEYHNQNRDYIRHSNKAMDYWLAKYDQYKPHKIPPTKKKRGKTK